MLYIHKHILSAIADLTALFSIFLSAAFQSDFDSLKAIITTDRHTIRMIRMKNDED